MNLTTNLVSGGFATGDTISGFEEILGSNFDDTVVGTSGYNYFRMYDGADVVDGAGGNEDRIDYLDSTAAVTLNFETNTFTGGYAADDTITNIEGGYGSNQSGDVLIGSSIENFLHGRNGDDTINGKGGRDLLYGGSGEDTFIFEAITAFADLDIIYDFSTAESDNIDISDVLVGFTVGVSNISDFVQFVDSGLHAIMQIDANGTVGGVSFSNVTQIQNQAGSLDATTLYANGDIIV